MLAMWKVGGYIYYELLKLPLYAFSIQSNTWYWETLSHTSASSLVAGGGSSSFITSSATWMP